jgi:hypothetical protein
MLSLARRPSSLSPAHQVRRWLSNGDHAVAIPPDGLRKTSFTEVRIKIGSESADLSDLGPLAGIRDSSGDAATRSDDSQNPALEKSDSKTTERRRIFSDSTLGVPF